MSEDEDEGAIDTLLAAVAAIPEQRPPRPTMGRYRIVRRLGAGGMGVVYAAVDPELDRQVAVTVMRQRTERDDSLAERLHREAQTLAKLSHANVVAVYDVGVEDGDLYIVMQLVEGDTLDQYVARQPRSTREIVALFLAAGRGLAAAHDAGIVHRDFKPSNVLVDRRHGQVRVSDFGLARDGTRRLATASGEAASASTTLTTSGVVGTPAYMAPEQFDARPVTPATDQFAFCVALWEALYGARPFSGDTLGDLATNVTTGKRAEPPLGRRVPRWLHAAIVRGLEIDPTARWPSMHALVDQLELVPKRRARTLVGVGFMGVALVAAGGAWLVGSRHAGAADPCSGASTRLVGVWDAARREHARAHLAKVDPADGAARFAIAAPLLDAYASSWGAMHVEACRANRVTGSQSDALFARRMSCLDRQLADLHATADLLDDASGLPAVDRALVAAHQLGDLGACADADALMAILPLPSEPERRHAIAAAQDAIDRVEQDRRAGKLDGLDARATAAVETARATKYAPVLAVALKTRARLLVDIGNVTAAAGVLRELTDVAAEAKDDATATWAWSHLLITVGWDLGQPQQAVALLPAANAALLRAGGGQQARVDFLYAKSGVLYGDHHVPEAHAALAEARSVLLAAGADRPGSPLMPRLADISLQSGVLYGTDGTPESAEPDFREAVRLYTAAYGPDHPEVAFAWQSLGDSLRWQGKGEDAIAAYREAVRIRATRTGETPALAHTLVSLNAVLVDLARYPEAMEPIDHAVKILRGGGDQVELATALMMKASTLDGVDKLDDAMTFYDESIALFESLGGQQNDLPTALNNRGNLYVRKKDYARAIADLDRAVEIASKTRGPDHPIVLDPLVVAAACLIELHRPAEALPRLERAMKIKAEGVDAPTSEEARYYHGRALYESGKDRAGGLAEVRAARATLAKMQGPIAKGSVDEADEWLRKLSAR
ncbi:MAG TPA: serine/threonine-protein kinase [Kofleriaceae bacterium]|nr:serine/threonine-protein kinase [Kofleriaceae bacterium]